MQKILREKLNIQKSTQFAVIFNGLQILAMAGIFVYALFKRTEILTHGAELVLLAFCLLIVVWGAMLDIHDAISTRKIAEQTRMLEEAYSQLEDLNALLRSQRHDFMNHLQVVFSLMEMREYNEAMRYIERIYGDIQRVNSVLKTSIPAINALIAAKHTDADEHGIAFETEISSAWIDLPVSGWEMCRVFGNLIDNARDAILEAGETCGRYIHISLSETPSGFVFNVANNGPAIAKRHIGSIFQLGYTTKSEGHGSGLSIVSEILESYGGRIEVVSTEEETKFSGFIPKVGMIPPKEVQHE